MITFKTVKTIFHYFKINFISNYIFLFHCAIFAIAFWVTFFLLRSDVQSSDQTLRLVSDDKLNIELEKIDWRCLFIFPLAFVLFNFVYWLGIANTEDSHATESIRNLHRV